MSENTEEIKTQEVEEAKLPKKSELLKEQVSLEKQYLSETKSMLEEEYSVKVGSKKNFDDLLKMAEHEFEFDHSTATGLALLYTNLKQQKPYTREDDWNGNIMLKTSSCLVLWKCLMSFKGKGFFEAKNFLAMIQLVGPELSKACGTIDKKNVSMRGIHARLEEIDSILDSGEFETDLTEEEEKAILATSESMIKAEHDIEDEVNPEVNI